MASAEVNTWVSNIKRMTVGPAVESLGDPSLTATTKWAGAGDFSDTISGAATYTHSSGSGTLTQVNGDLDVVNVANSPYRLIYTLGTVTAGAVITLTTWGSTLAVDLPATAGEHTVDFTSGSSTSGSFVITATSATVGIFSITVLSLIHGSAEQIKTTRQEVLTLTVRAEANNTGTITLVNDAHSILGTPLNAGDTGEFSAEVYDTIDLRDLFWRASVDTDGFHYTYRQ